MKTTFISKHWDAVTASVAGCIFIFLFTRHSGIGISPDSVNYESTATHIRQHFSFTDFNSVPLVDFPLGYPSLLALISFITGLPVLQLAPVWNMILFCGVLFLTSIIISHYRNTSFFYKACFLSVLACSPFLLEIYSMLWSETLFLFLTLFFIVTLHRYFSNTTIKNLVLVSIVAALAFVTRYAGITVLATGLFLIFFNGDIPQIKKIKHLFIFGLTGSSLAVANLIRNNIVSGNATGVREKALRTLTANFYEAGAVMENWFPFLKNHTTAATFIFFTVLMAGIAVVVFAMLQQQFYPSYETITACFFVAYSLFILLIATLSRFEDLSSRLLSPLYIPALLLGSSWMLSVYKNAVRSKKIIIICIALIVFAGFHVNQYQLNAEAWEGIKDSGMPGYAEGSWTKSPVVALVKKWKPALVSPVYANANDAVYFLTGVHALALPHKEMETEKNAFLQHPFFSLIWFNDGDNPDLVNLAYIRAHKKQISVRETESGAIYFFADSTMQR